MTFQVSETDGINAEFNNIYFNFSGTTNALIDAQIRFTFINYFNNKNLIFNRLTEQII